MAGTFKLEVAVPDRLLIETEAESLRAPAVGGSLGVLPGHAPLLTEIGVGVLSYKADGRTRYVSLNGGVMEIQPECVRLLANTAEWAEEVDVKRAEVSLRRAMDILRNHDMSINVERAQAAVARAQTRLDAWKQAGKPARQAPPEE